MTKLGACGPVRRQRRGTGGRKRTAPCWGSRATSSPVRMASALRMGTGDGTVVASPREGTTVRAPRSTMTMAALPQAPPPGSAKRAQKAETTAVGTVKALFRRVSRGKVG